MDINFRVVELSKDKALATLINWVIDYMTIDRDLSVLLISEMITLNMNDTKILTELLLKYPIFPNDITISIV